MMTDFKVGLIEEMERDLHLFGNFCGVSYDREYSLVKLIHRIWFGNNETFAILGRQRDNVQFIERIKNALDDMPRWCQTGYVYKNKTGLQLLNATKIMSFTSHHWTKGLCINQAILQRDYNEEGIVDWLKIQSVINRNFSYSRLP